MSPSFDRFPMRRLFTAATALLLSVFAARAVIAQTSTEAGGGTSAIVKVVQDANGSRLQVDGKDFLVRGMNWDYCPIGQNYSYNLWDQPEDMIQAALDREMPLLAGAGVNAIRIYAGIPTKWVKYIHDRYGIYCIINHTVGRYGFTVDGVWHVNTDYSDPKTRAAIAAEVAGLVKMYKGTPGVLMYLLGNENNYGLSWASFEIEALPKGERDTARARYLYSLFEEIAKATKAADPDKAVAIANGDLQYIDVIAQECKDIDILGTNVYRGISAGDLYQKVHDKLGIPVMYTEFGSDAFNAKDMREDQAMQAKYVIGQWNEVYRQSAGHGGVGNAIGGCVFQWADGWWKYKQEERLDIHDTNASWPDGAYTEDYVQGDNNMNEEWWGICAKGAPDNRGLYDLYPRAAYYALRRIWTLDPYAATTTNEVIRDHFAKIAPTTAALEARGDKASQALSSAEKIQLSGARLQFDTYSTGGYLLTTPHVDSLGHATPGFRGFDHQESFYADLTARPSPNVSGYVSVNVLGNVARNAIDQISYENRGYPHTFVTQDTFYVAGVPHVQSIQSSGLERVKVYRASISWTDRYYDAEAFYRTGHYHWGYKGDFFGLYREANYGPNLDIYNGEAPVGVEITGKRALDGLVMAFGPQLWWGANAAVLAKYQRQLRGFTTTGVYENDVAPSTNVNTSSAIGTRPTQKFTLGIEKGRGNFALQAGGIWAGANRIDNIFPIAYRNKAEGSYDIFADHIVPYDTYGGKAKLTYEKGRFHWYGQTAHMGLVAEGGPTLTTTFTGWNLKDTGSGNQTNFLSGFAYNSGKWQFAPNFLWQKPLVGPMPADAPSPGRLRNIFDDPFAVRANREMTAAEVLISFDPTPATWLYAWDNDLREDARLAGSVGFVYRHMPTGQDASIGFLSDGKTFFAFPSSKPARDLWEVNTRTVSRLTAKVRMVTHAFAGTGEPNGNDSRLVRRFGGDVRFAGPSVVFNGYAKWNDWGPYDYHRDFNLTYPVQLMGDLSHTLGNPLWLESNQTRIGVRWTWRSLDKISPRYLLNSADYPAGIDQPHGSEWEIRTYVRLEM